MNSSERRDDLDRSSHFFDSSFDALNQEEKATRNQNQKTANEEQQLLESNIKNQPSMAAKFTQKILKKIKTKGFKRGGIVASVFGLLFAGGLGISAILSPGIALSQMAETLFSDLNSSLAGTEKTDLQLRRAKFKTATSGCGAVKIACRFKTMNIEKATKMYERQNIKVTFDENTGFGKGRGRISSMEYTNPQNGQVTKINSAAEYEKLRKSDINFRTADINARSPKFHLFKNNASMKYMTKIKTSFSKKLNGNTTEELDNDVKKATSYQSNLKQPSLKPERDKDGKETGNFVDENGKVYSKAEAEQIKTSYDRIKTAPRTGALIDGLTKGAAVTGIADSACSVFNTMRAVSFASKIYLKAELARWYMVYANTYSAMKAGDATPEQIEYISKPLSEKDMRQTVPDESKMDSVKAGDKLPEIKNPDYGKSGLDAAFYKQSAFQDKPKIGLREQRFMVGGGLTGTLDSVNQTIATALGTNSPKDLTNKCKVVQNPAVRGGALVVGILAGVGSLGASFAFSVAGSLALQMSLPFLVSRLGEVVTGNVTEGLTGQDAVNAAAVGASSYMNGIARSQGFVPLSPEEMADYQNENRQTEIAYQESEKILAKNTPFDMNNQFSFIGILARASLPIMVEFKQPNFYSSFNAVSSIFNSSLSSITPNASAISSRKINPDRYKQCNDITYQEMNVAADTSCSLLFGLPKEAMDADPVEVAEWMAANGEIDPNSETGEAKDNKQDWNYVKFLKNCIDQEPGAHEDPEASPDNGYACVAPENREKNWHYAKYTVAKNWNETLDGELPAASTEAQTSFSSGAEGAVSSSGWAFPTTQDAIITSPFGMRNGAPHRGVDLAQPGGAEGKPIFAARDGKVIAAGPASGFGQWIILEHNVDGQTMNTVYGHMWENGVHVKVGDEVKAGQEIGAIGNNGQSSGAHLHFEIWQGSRLNGGSAIDPADIIEKARQGGGGS